MKRRRNNARKKNKDKVSEEKKGKETDEENKEGNLQKKIENKRKRISINLSLCG